MKDLAGSLINVFVLCFGAALGSFLNVCIYRLPRGRSVVSPRSQCPHCEKMIPWYDNIPILSYLLLGGKCRFCRGSISWRYPLVEALSALVLVLLWERFAFSLAFLVYAALTASLLVATFVDFDHYIIPDVITLPGIIIGLALSLLVWALPPVEGRGLFIRSFPPSLFGLAMGSGLLLAVGFLSLLIFKKEGMGGGDVKLLGMIGAFLGWKWTLMVAILASTIGGIVGLLLIGIKLKKRTDYIPFGPYLSLGAIAIILFEDILRAFFIRFYGVSL